MTFHAKRGLIDFMENCKINCTVMAREFNISRGVHPCSKPFSLCLVKKFTAQHENEDREMKTAK